MGTPWEAHSVPGTAPGLDFKRQDYDNLHDEYRCSVKLVCCDYSEKQVVFHPPISNAEVPAFLAQPRPAWSKVRWIHVEGLSWDVVLALAHRFDIHPLAVEDILSTKERIKADFYTGLLYCTLISVTLGDGTPSYGDAPTLMRVPDACDTSHHGGGGGTDALRRRLFSHRLSRDMDCAPVRKGKGQKRDEENVYVVAEPVSLLLLHDGTIISIFQGTMDNVTTPIYSQLRRERTLVRECEDASFLLNLLVDSVVDHVLPVVHAYSTLLQDYEQAMLRKRPEASATRVLHVMQGDLNLLKRTLLPASSLIQSLRCRVDPSQILRAPSLRSSPRGGTNGGGGGANGGGGGSGGSGGGGVNGGGHHHPPGSIARVSLALIAAEREDAQPLISALTRTYLSDVQDHVLAQLDLMESLAQQCKNLSDLIFNLNSHLSNSQTKTLSVVSVVFLPITFLAGVYGTNFVNLPELNWSWGYGYFWGLCVLVSAASIALLTWLGMAQSY